MYIGNPITEFAQLTNTANARVKSFPMPLSPTFITLFL